MDSLIKLLEFFLECVPLWRFFKIVERFPESFSLWSFESFLPGSIVFFCKFRLLEIIHFFFNVFSLFLNNFDSFRINVNSIWSLLDVSLESLSEFFPLFHEFLTLRRLEELLIQFFNSLDLFSGSPLLECTFDSFHWSSMLDLLSNLLNIVKFLLDSLGTSISNFDLKHIEALLPVFWNISHLHIFLNRMLELSHLLLKGLTLW